MISIEKFYETNTVPENFDHDLYLKQQKEAIDFYQPHAKLCGFSEAERLYFHYVQYGKSNGIIMPTTYKVEGKPASKDNTTFILFSTYYNSPVRDKELDYCLLKNLENKYIDKVNLFVTKETIIPDNVINNEKLNLLFIEKKIPSYLDWIEHSEDIDSEDFITIFSNADIYFDETIQNLKTFLKDKNDFVCLSRYEYSSIDQHYSLFTRPNWSQDTWALSDKSLKNITFKESLNIPTGKPRCDNKIAYKFAYNGYDLYNACYHVKTYHEHETNYREYDDKTDAILGAVCFVEPTTNSNIPSEKQYIIGTTNADDTNSYVHVSDFLSNRLTRKFNIIYGNENVKHLYGGWASVSKKMQTCWKKEIKFNLITFLWESYQDFEKDLTSCSWVGIEHLTNYCPPYYEKALGKMPTISNFYTKLWNEGILEHCNGILFTSRYTRESNMNMSYMNNIKSGVAHHPILVDKHCKLFTMDNYTKNENKKLINLGWFNRNFAVFEKLNIDSHHSKEFIFGGMKDYRYKIFQADMEYHNINTVQTKISDRLTDQELNDSLSENIIFINLYDSSANNAIINAIQRNCPIILNRLPACEEYIGREYPLFYKDKEEINDLLSEEKIEQAHQYLKNINIEKFSLDTIITEINNFI